MSVVEETISRIMGVNLVVVWPHHISVYIYYIK